MNEARGESLDSKQKAANQEVDAILSTARFAVECHQSGMPRSTTSGLIEGEVGRGNIPERVGKLIVDNTERQG